MCLRSQTAELLCSSRDEFDQFMCFRWYVLSSADMSCWKKTSVNQDLKVSSHLTTVIIIVYCSVLDDG